MILSTLCSLLAGCSVTPVKKIQKVIAELKGLDAPQSLQEFLQNRLWVARVAGPEGASQAARDAIDEFWYWKLRRSTL